MTDDGDKTLTDQIRAKVRQREAERFAEQNASMLAEAERTAQIQRGRGAGYPKSEWIIAGVLAVVGIPLVIYFFGGDEAATPKTTAEIRQDQLSAGFSGWNGSHIDLTRHIKAAMNDPDSYEHVSTRFADKGDHLIVTTSFRGANAFGGKVVNTWTAKTSIDGRVLQIISTQ